MVFDFQGIYPYKSQQFWVKVKPKLGRKAYAQFAYHPLSNSFWMGQAKEVHRVAKGAWVVPLLFFFTLHHWEVTRNANLEDLEDDFSFDIQTLSRLMGI